MFCTHCKDHPGKMTLISCWDDAQQTDHAYNLYQCKWCGNLVYDSIWEDKCRLWIFKDGSVLSSKDTMYVPTMDPV